MWHDKKNTQLKNILPLYAVLLIYSKVKASQILHDETTPVAPSKNWIKAISIRQTRKTFPVFHISLVVKKITRNTMLTWLISNKYSTSYWRNTLSYNICHWVDNYRLLQNIWLFLANTSNTFSSIIDHYEIPTFLIHEQESSWIL